MGADVGRRIGGAALLGGVGQDDAAGRLGRRLGFDHIARRGAAGDFIDGGAGGRLAQQLGFADLTARRGQGHLLLGGRQDLLGGGGGRRTFATGFVVSPSNT